MRKTLKQKLHHYISKKQDICCEEDVDRLLIIQQIINKYKKISAYINEPGEYLNYINNDLVKFIGYKVDLKDAEDRRLWNELDKKMYKNKKVNENKIEALLKDIPLYLLLAFLGFASYREDQSIQL
jgi:hypothetical protein